MAAAKNKSYTVLVVDDDPDLLQLLADGLELLGNFKVVSASNGIQGLELFFEVRPDCMIIDIKMPGLDGYQLVRALRGDADSASTPLIILSALAQEQNQFAGLALGADDYLVKLVSIETVVAAVQRAVQIGAEERQKRMQALLGEDNAAGAEWFGADAPSPQEAGAEQNR
jgi:two-component system, OmpR family, alkaline phosphatase synthesis response regulator PhoP